MILVGEGLRRGRHPDRAESRKVASVLRAVAGDLEADRLRAAALRSAVERAYARPLMSGMHAVYSAGTLVGALVGAGAA